MNFFYFGVKRKRDMEIGEYGPCCTRTILCSTKNCRSKSMENWYWFIKTKSIRLHRHLFLLNQRYHCPVGWGCRIHWLLLGRGVRPPPQWVSCYDAKQSDGEVPVMLELWGRRSTPLLPSLLGPLWPGVVAPDKGPIYWLNRTNCILMLNWIVWIRTVWLNWLAWNRNVFHN